MVGIYIIKNTINQKVYIGRSTDINRRWATHLRDAKNGSLCKIHLAMNKLGINNFYFEVLEECEVKELNNREQYYIDLYNSWHSGYNNGNSSNFLNGEDNPNCKMTKEDIYDIRFRQSLMSETRKEIYKDYEDRITLSNFLFICNYKTWVDILNEFNTTEIINWHKERSGNGIKKFSKSDLEKIIILRYKEKMSYQKIGDMYGKNRKTIERIFTNFYYKKEMEELKHSKPELFQN